MISFFTLLFRFFVVYCKYKIEKDRKGKAMSITTYYETLGVSRRASDEEIKSQYKKLAKEYHPDVNPNAADLFREIVEAYNVLSDPRKRANYNEMIRRAEEEASHKQVSIYNSTANDNGKSARQREQEEYNRQLVKLAENVDLLTRTLEQQYRDDRINSLANTVNNLVLDRYYAEVNEMLDGRTARVSPIQRDNCDLESDMYYKDPHRESIFTIIYNWCEYRFENAFAGVWKRNFVAILGAMFVYLLAIPFLFINKFLFFLKPRHKKFFGWHWVSHMHYLLYKDSLIGTIFWTILLAFMFVTKTIFTALYIVYWLFKNVIRFFLLPIAIILAAIIRTFGRVMLVNPNVRF